MCESQSRIRAVHQPICKVFACSCAGAYRSEDRQYVSHITIVEPSSIYLIEGVDLLVCRLQIHPTNGCS
jgi:hypothetical protein